MTSATRSPRRSAWIIPGLILLVAAGLMGVSALRGGGDPGGGTGAAGTSSQSGAAAPSPTSSPATTLDMARRDPNDPLAAGPVDAPVVLVAYSDYQCPFCAMWVHDTEPAMMKLVAAGDLRIEWRDVNVYGPNSTRAAQAAYAAGLQGKFWEYHDGLYAGGKKRDPSGLSPQALTVLATDLGLDVPRFTADFTSSAVAAAVQANADEGAKIGVTSTPSFLIGGHPVIGAQPTQVFVDAVQSALAEAKG